MLSEYVGKFFINDREVFKVLDADYFVVTLLICPLHPSLSTSNYRFVEEVIDTYTYTTAEAKRRIESAREIEEDMFVDIVNHFINELLEIC